MMIEINKEICDTICNYEINNFISTIFWFLVFYILIVIILKFDIFESFYFSKGKYNYIDQKEFVNDEYNYCGCNNAINIDFLLEKNKVELESTIEKLEQKYGKKNEI